MEQQINALRRVQARLLDRGLHTSAKDVEGVIKHLSDIGQDAPEPSKESEQSSYAGVYGPNQGLMTEQPNQVLRPYLPAPNETQGTAKERGNPVDRDFADRREEEAQVEQMAINIARNLGPDMMVLKMICRSDVREFKNRKEIERIKKHDTFTRQMAGDAWKELERLNHELKNKTEVIGILFDSIREHEMNIKSAFQMAESAKEENSKLHLRIHELHRAHNELNQQINGEVGAGTGWIRSSLEQLKKENLNLAMQLKAVQSRLAKEWDKKRR